MILVINNAGPADIEFNRPLFEAIEGVAGYELVDYTEIPSLDILNQYDAIVVSGVPHHYPFSSIEGGLSYFQWVEEVDVPVLGICLGHQILGKLFGSSVIQNTEAEKGNTTVRIKQADPLFARLSTEVDTYMLHRASITVPDDFVLLGSSPVCKNVIMKHKTRSIYGVQFHPELSKDGLVLLRNFVKLKQHQHAIYLAQAV